MQIQSLTTDLKMEVSFIFTAKSVLSVLVLNKGAGWYDVDFNFSLFLIEENGSCQKFLPE